MAYAMVEQFDAFEDNPWPLLYRELDERFPGSKFILTRRPTENWINSQVKDFATTGNADAPGGSMARTPAALQATRRSTKHAMKSTTRTCWRILLTAPTTCWLSTCRMTMAGRACAHSWDMRNPTNPFPHANKASLSRKLKNWLKNRQKPGAVCLRGEGLADTFADAGQQRVFLRVATFHDVAGSGKHLGIGSGVPCVPISQRNARSS